MGKRRKKVILTLCIAAAVIIALYFGLVNFLVSAALVPSFMQKLEAFERAAVQFWAVPAAIRSIHAHIPVCKARTLAENDNGNSLLAIFLLQVKRRVLFHPSWRMRQRLHHRYRPWKIRTQLAKEVMGGVKRSFKCRDACLFQVFQPPVRNFLQHNIHPLRPA